MSEKAYTYSVRPSPAGFVLYRYTEGVNTGMSPGYESREEAMRAGEAWCARKELPTEWIPCAPAVLDALSGKEKP